MTHKHQKNPPNVGGKSIKTSKNKKNICYKFALVQEQNYVIFCHSHWSKYPKSSQKECTLILISVYLLYIKW